MSSDLEQQPESLEARARVITRAVERARFAGASPRVELPPDAEPWEIVARTLAAERLGAPLALGEAVHHFQDEQAAEELRSAQQSLRIWSFGVAEARIDRATARALDPALQQRLGIWKLLAGLLRRFVRTEPTEAPRGAPARSIFDLVAAADRLAEDECAHYRAEVERLVETDTRARTDPASIERVLWYVIRARLALGADEPAAALLWCLQLARLQPSALTAATTLPATTPAATPPAAATPAASSPTNAATVPAGTSPADATPAAKSTPAPADAPTPVRADAAAGHDRAADARTGAAASSSATPAPATPAPTDTYLTGLLAQARLAVLLALGDLDGEAAEGARKAAAGLQAWDVYRALLAHLGASRGLDLQREIARYTVAAYRDADA